MKSAEVLANNPEPSVANLKKIFKPAEDAQKSGDGVSEIFTFCFDEIDAMLMPEKEWDLPSKSQEAIRLELQSMLSGPQSYNNIIVIGTTNLEPSRFPAGAENHLSSS
ncbi:AAA family ATPase [Endozoicomonas sp. YOMI1]|uniref:AAA family ATPase n=1 Tax=Endozoicomonas sp. YOMI1 TaxID=2828739 RepID=UPI0035A103D5